MQVMINIDVNDIRVATDFYTRAFNLKVGRTFGEGYVELLGLASPIYLLLTKEGSSPFEGAKEGRSFTRHWTPVHLDVAVDDIELALKRATDAGAKAESEIMQRAWGKIVLLSDPFGNGFCILQLEGAGYDAIATV
jgi:predicted enzyme related to lactoylglutathione lyase